MATRRAQVKPRCPWPLHLRDDVDDASVDLVYLGPPFNSNRSYKESSRAAIEITA